MTANFFSVLRTAPLLGRPFTAENEVEGRAPVVVISHGLWQRRFGGTPDIIGARLPGTLASFEIVGVMPPGFTYPVDTYVLGAREPTDAWIPFVFTSEDRVRGHSFGYNLHVVGRFAMVSPSHGRRRGWIRSRRPWPPRLPGGSRTVWRRSSRCTSS